MRKAIIAMSGGVDSSVAALLTNKSLIETLDELNKIQSEGRAKRAAAEQELTRIEDELKQKMMEIRS